MRNSSWLGSLIFVWLVCFACFSPTEAGINIDIENIKPNLATPSSRYSIITAKNVDKIVQVGEIKRTTAGIMSVSPDGKTVALADELANIWLCSVEALDCRELGAHAQIRDLSWSPDSRLLASSSSGCPGTTLIWNIDEGQSQPIKRSLRSANEVAWSPDGKQLISVDADGLSLWNTVTMENLRLPDIYVDSYLAWSPDSRWIAAGSFAKVRLWDIKNPDRPPYVLAGYVPRRVIEEGAAPCGNKLSCTSSGGIPLITHIAWSPNGRKIAGIGGYGGIQVWDVTSPEDTYILTDYKSIRKRYDSWSELPNYPTSIAWAWHEPLLVSGHSLDGTLRVWDSTNQRQIRIIEGHNAITAVAWMPDGTRLISTGREEIVRIWGIPSIKRKGIKDVTGKSNNNASRRNIKRGIFRPAGDYPGGFCRAYRRTGAAGQ